MNNPELARHIVAAAIVVGTVVLLAVLRMLGIAPTWLIVAVVVFNVAIVAGVLMHVAGDGGPVWQLAAFTTFLLVALGVLTWYAESGGYEGETLRGFITTGIEEREPAAENELK